MKKFIKDNYFKIGILIILFIVALAIFYYFVFFIPQKRRVNIVFDRDKINSQNEDNCLKQAEVFFNKIKTQGNAYTNHYNSKLNKCFILTYSISSSGDNDVVVTKSLYNVTENSHYAGYYKSISSGDTNENTKPQNCWYLDKYCQSEEEFDSFVSLYMNN